MVCDVIVDAEALAALRDQHAAWGLLRYEHGPMALGCLHRVFVAPNVRTVAQPDLVEALEDDLHALRAVRGEQAAPRPASDYLVEWSSNERGWLRRFYPPGSDEPAFDLTPAAEQAISWVVRLADRPFVGTESRMRSLFDLLEQMAVSTEADPDVRLADLERQRAAIDAEIEQVRRGNVEVIDDRMLKERFQQFVSLARELLADFRQVEHNFRMLDRRVREQIAGWDGAKGALVGEILGERDAIADSDEGQSFRAFWEFLMSQARQEQMTDNLERVLAQPAITELHPDRRIRRVHFDWLEAGEYTQRTVALLSTQLRRFLDDTAWLEDRRIVELLRSIESSALAVREDPPPGSLHAIDLPTTDIALPFERPLFTPKQRASISDIVEASNGEELDVAELFAQQVVDVERLADHIERSLDERGQITLGDLCQLQPLEHGLAEVVTYLQLGSDRFNTTIEESVSDVVTWWADGVERSATMPRVVFVA
jgi:hypothetical protein